MPLIGTAGHVDHGKSTLIQRLTGRDPDRWEEEKRRGLTIDLGFAWTTLPSGIEVSFVDVPGHERYLKNMLAGVEAIDVALFVVAADEGWKPQSEEHLAVLDLLEVDRGVIALTKLDLVDPELAELATLEVIERLHGTALADAPVKPVSAVDRRGMEELLSALDDIVGAVAVDDQKRPRLWIDRSFPVRGAGTVVTGTLLGGGLAVGDEVVVHPEAHRARIRGIQTHERAVDEVKPGRRVALNLSGVDHSQLTRGQMVGGPEHWEVTTRFLAEVRAARYVENLDPRGAYQLHVGTATLQMRFAGIDDGHAVIVTDAPFPAATGDPFIIRDTGRRLVTAGGRVLDPSPGGAKRALRAAARIDPRAAPDAIAAALLQTRGNDSIRRLTAHSRGGRPPDAIEIGDRYLTPDELDGLAGTMKELVEQYHRTHPLRPGVPVATLAERLGVGQEVVGRIVADDQSLQRVGPDVSLADHSVELGEGARAAWERAREELGRGLAVPTIAELGLDPEVLHLLVRTGELVRIADDLAFLPEQVAQLEELIEAMPADFTVADFRDASSLSRKYAVPILEWSDREGITFRRGDTRTVR
ncbi:MAG: selenocysteine-specific translation elongation factor [Actinobacteria bacterium]|nr:selenocysteine-specific translation elongation factor [Actinomycetota bacterium]